MNPVNAHKPSALSAAERSVLQQAVALAESNGYRTQTEWILITGAPGSGKTTLINCLSKLGWRTNSDPGRDVLEDEIASGYSVSEVRSDYPAFQERVVARIMLAMQTLERDIPVFFDYGMAETLAFLRTQNMPWSNAFIEQAVRFKFAKVFLLEMVPLDPPALNDAIRVEDEIRRRHLHQLICEIYVALGNQVFLVPCLPVEDRINAITAKLGFPER